MTRTLPLSSLRRAGLVLATALLGAVMLLGAAAGPAHAAGLGSNMREADGDWTQGEARFETLPSLQPQAGAARKPVQAASLAWRGARDPWLAAGLTLGAPLALALPAAAGIWAPVAASPLALAAGHLYAGDLSRGALVGLGGLGATAGGALLGLGGGSLLGAPAQGAMLLGGGLGLTAYAAWAAGDAFRTAGGVGKVEVVSLSTR